MGIPTWQLILASLESYADEDLLNMILEGNSRAGYMNSVLQNRQNQSRNLRRHKMLRKVNKYFVHRKDNFGLKPSRF